MADRATSGPRARVVVLSPDTATAGEDVRALRDEGIELVRAASAYEAVAEMLCEPATALVIDLRLLGARGLRALEIARQRGIEVLATGTVPRGLTSEDLSGVRLLAKRELPDALRRLADQLAAGPDVLGIEGPTLSPVEPPEGTYVAEGAGVETVEARPGAEQPDEGAPADTLTPEYLAALLERPAAGALEAPAVSPVEPPAVSPVEPPAVSPVEPPAVSPVEPPEGTYVAEGAGVETVEARPGAGQPDDGAPANILTPEELAALLEKEP